MPARPYGSVDPGIAQQPGGAAEAFLARRFAVPDVAAANGPNRDPASRRTRYSWRIRTSEPIRLTACEGGLRKPLQLPAL